MDRPAAAPERTSGASVPPGRQPWGFVPTLYVLQGLAYFVVNSAANLFFSLMGVPAARVTHLTNDLTLPWMLKPLWSPVVDLFGSKRGWLLGSAAVTVLGIVALAWAATAQDYVRAVTWACVAIAVAGATNDIATDGYYIHALDRERQELFVGVRSAAFRLGRIAVTGGAAVLAGWLIESRGFARPRAWAVAFLMCAATYALLSVWHVVWLPRPATDGPVRGRSGGWSALRESLRAYFAKPGIAGAIVFIFFYRVAESLLTPVIAKFLSSPRTLAVAGDAARIASGAGLGGGLGLDDAQIGWIYGTVGASALVLGGILGGVLVSRFGLRRCLWPMALAMHAPNLLYAWAASRQPGLGGTVLVVGVEQLGYGLGFTTYVTALLTLSRGTRHSTTHYALSTGLMALSAWLFGRFSGDVVERVGFEHFFWIVSAAGLVGLATLPLVPRESSPSPRVPGR